MRGGVRINFPRIIAFLEITYVKELLGLEAISQQAFIFLSNGRCCADRNL